MCVSAYSHPKYRTGYAICVAVGRSANDMLTYRECIARCDFVHRLCKEYIFQRVN